MRLLLSRLITSSGIYFGHKGSLAYNRPLYWLIVIAFRVNDDDLVLFLARPDVTFFWVASNNSRDRLGCSKE